MTPAEIRALAPALLPPGGLITRLSMTAPVSKTPDVVIAVPARDEAADIQHCIGSLARSIEHAGVDCLLILVVNNTIDATHDLALGVAQRLGLALLILSVHLPGEHAHVGHARGFAMDLGAALSGTRSILMTTDADTVVGLEWVKANLTDVRGGAALVCGAIALNAADDAALPQLMRDNGAAEGRYLGKMRHLEALIDPDPHNAWPHHGSIGGASMALARCAYLSIGGLPRIPSSEDRALLERCREHDLPVVFSSRAHVVTSGRFAGRAPGGLAETLTLRDHDPTSPLDVRAEPAIDWHTRLHTRAVARFLHRQNIGLDVFAEVLGLAPEKIELIRSERRFGTAWAKLELSTSLSRRTRLRPFDIQREEPVLDRLLAAARAQQAKFLKPVPWADRPGSAGRKSDRRRSLQD